MWSYDGMLVAPVIAFLVGVVYLQKKKLALLYLLCIPLYLWMRSASGALAPSGDYGYKVSTFFVNSISNTAGYSLSLVLGPQMIELWNSVRINLRSYIKEISIGMSITLFVISILTWKLKAKLFVYKKSMLWFLCYLVSLIAYIPLGGMAERYVYIPSIFALVGLTILVYAIRMVARTSAQPGDGETANARDAPVQVFTAFGAGVCALRVEFRVMIAGNVQQWDVQKADERLQVVI